MSWLRKSKPTFAQRVIEVDDAYAKCKRIIEQSNTILKTSYDALSEPELYLLVRDACEVVLDQCLTDLKVKLGYLLNEYQEQMSEEEKQKMTSIAVVAAHMKIHG